MTAEDWWVSLTNCKIHHAGVRAWNCPPEPHKPWVWKYCMTVHATRKGDFERCLVLLFFLPLAAWHINARMALTHSSPGSGCAGWGCSQEEPFGAHCGAEPEMWGSPLVWEWFPLLCFSLYQSARISRHLPELQAHLGQLCPAFAAEGELSMYTSGLLCSHLCFHVDRASVGPHAGCPWAECCRTRLHRALRRGLAASSDPPAHLWRSEVCVVDVPSPWSLLLGPSRLEGCIYRELCAVDIPSLRPASFILSLAIKYCWCPSPHWWNEAWRLKGGFL